MPWDPCGKVHTSHLTVRHKMPDTYQIKNKMSLINETVRHIIVFYGFTFFLKSLSYFKCKCRMLNKKTKNKDTIKKRKRKKKRKNSFQKSFWIHCNVCYIICVCVVSGAWISVCSQCGCMYVEPSGCGLEVFCDLWLGLADSCPIRCSDLWGSPCRSSWAPGERAWMNG